MDRNGECGCVLIGKCQFFLINIDLLPFHVGRYCGLQSGRRGFFKRTQTGHVWEKRSPVDFLEESTLWDEKTHLTSSGSLVTITSSARVSAAWHDQKTL